MTARHPNDAYLTPPCAAIAIGRALFALPGYVPGALLDPFAAAGSLLVWAGELCTDSRFDAVYAFEMDARWGPELGRRVHPFNTRLGRDSFAMPWTVFGHAPHIITNPPFGRTQTAIEMAMDHARTHRRWAAVLMRTGWWQHPGRGHLAPDHFLALQWRPVFGMNKHLKFSTDYAGYVWCVWEPNPTGICRMGWLARPEVPKEMVAEHRRLARLAHQMGAAMAQGERA